MTAISMSIQDFIASVPPAGLARVSLFRAIISGPAVLGVRRDLSFRTHHVNFPGRTVETGELATYGPSRQVATGTSFGTVDIAVYLSPDFGEKLFFQRWQSLASGYATATNAPSSGMFDIGYYENYIGSVVLQQLDTAGEVRYSCSLEEAWPTVVSPLAAEWGSDDIHKLGVTFAFRRFVDDTGSSTATLFPSSSASLSLSPGVLST
jgi:hypothetical protein